MSKGTPCRLETVSPSMILSVFTQLKENGYSESQILALSKGLVEYTSERLSPRRQKPTYLSLAGNNHEDIQRI
jgi:hypothetical protein